jgi:hypothetical protein
MAALPPRSINPARWPPTFTGSGDIVGGTPTDPGVEPGRNFIVQGTGDQGQPLYQAFTSLRLLCTRGRRFSRPIADHRLGR